MPFPTPFKCMFPLDMLHQDSFCSSISLSSSFPNIAFVFTATADCVVQSVYLRFQVVTLGGTLRAGIQSVTPGPAFPAAPSGTWLGATANGFGTVASPAGLTTYEVALGEAVTLTKGTTYAINIEWVGGTGTGSLYRSANTATVMPSTPAGDLTNYCIVKSGATWTVSAVARPGTALFIGLRHNADRWWNPGWCLPASSFAAPTPNNTSSPDEYGNRMYLPKGYITALWAVTNSSASTVLTLYDASDNLLLSLAVPYGYRGGNTFGPLYSYPTSPLLTKEGWYRATIKSTSSSACTVYTTTFFAEQQNSRHMKDHCLLTTRTAGGAWTDTANGQTLVGVEMCFDLPVSGIPMSRVTNRM